MAVKHPRTWVAFRPMSASKSGYCRCLNLLTYHLTYLSRQENRFVSTTYVVRHGGVRPSDTPMLNLPTSPCQTMKSGNLMKKAFQGK
ncbi:hypothetical protein FR991_21000 [Bacteroides fragilis]|uniref:Uncharacterized protein n=1 Tax=Bacteroides fragilis TaxID=817 RepID=A0A5C6H7B9_BACFG|nr:hypothetical protein F2Z30_14520 [Bacteroides fragilis]KAA5191642.1 hypothetical protein F2Z50_17015 [Bacteroides fragilis]KAA5194521.1 hypothetical protein F2Z24_21285 [Bacteroides fragilis]KAA5200797.1 hypothetical protein F2Z84_13630 [Bacteroides fragilis]KAA5205557.1 hypothetical protein F2Z25_18005 [Bacteroides fragilis]